MSPLRIIIPTSRYRLYCMVVPARWLKVAGRLPVVGARSLVAGLLAADVSRRRCERIRMPASVRGTVLYASASPLMVAAYGPGGKRGENPY